jgi:hypothetical protein
MAARSGCGGFREQSGSVDRSVNDLDLAKDPRFLKVEEQAVF